MIDLLGLGALVSVAAEWLLLGWLSGVAFPPPSTAASAAVRLLVGAFLVGLAQLVLSLSGVGFASTPIVFITAAVGAAALRFSGGQPCRVPGPANSSSPRTRRGEALVRERVGWLVLGGVLGAALIRSLLVPESGWDAYSHWGLRAQAFAQAGTIVDAHSEHEYYPPLVPLLEAWLYAHRGAVAIDLGKTVWALMGSAFAICLAWHLRLTLRQPALAPYVALGIVLSTTALLEGFWTGQADLALTAYLTLATLALLQWQNTPDRAWLVQAAVFSAAAALTKFEGLPRVAVIVVALLLEAAFSLKQMRRPYLVAASWIALAAVGATLLWTVFELSHAIAPNAEHLGGLQPLAIGGVLLTLAAVFGGVRTGGGLLVAILAWALVGRAILQRPLRFLTLVVLGQLVATLVAFLLSSTSPELEVRTSATRLFEQFLPLALFVGAVGLIEGSIDP